VSHSLPVCWCVPCLSSAASNKIVDVSPTFHVSNSNSVSVRIFSPVRRENDVAYRMVLFQDDAEVGKANDAKLCNDCKTFFGDVVKQITGNDTLVSADDELKIF
jgi:hypothetical protein